MSPTHTSSPCGVPSGGGCCYPISTINNIQSGIAASTVICSSDSGISSAISSTPSLTQLSPPPPAAPAVSNAVSLSILASTVVTTSPHNNNNVNNSNNNNGSTSCTPGSGSGSGGRCSPIIGGITANLSNGLASSSCIYGAVATNTSSAGSTLLYAERTSPALAMMSTNCKTKTLSPLQSSSIGVALSTYAGGGSGTCASAAAPITTQTNTGTNYLNTIKLLGPAASIDLGTSPLTHRNYPSIKGFTFRRSFDDKIISTSATVSGAAVNNSQLGVAAMSSAAYLSHFPVASSHHHHHYHHHLQQQNQQIPHFAHYHPQYASHHNHHNLNHHPLHHHHPLGGSGSSFHGNFITFASNAAGNKHSVASIVCNNGGNNYPPPPMYAPLTSSQSTTKLSHREDFLQQIGYLPTTRIYSTPSSLDEDKAQQDFLSLSLSPPLNRRRDMPALRGPYVSL